MDTNQNKIGQNQRNFYRNIGYTVILMHLSIYSHSVYVNLMFLLPDKFQELKLENIYLQYILQIIGVLLTTFIAHSYLRSFYFLVNGKSVNQKKQQNKEKKENDKECEVCKTVIRSNYVHCYYCDKCVQGQDQHCFFFINCIDKQNYKFFFAFIVNAMIWYALCFYLNYTKLAEIFAEQKNLMDLNIAMLMLTAVISFFYLILITFLFFYNLYLILNNITTSYDYLETNKKVKIISFFQITTCIFSIQKMSEIKQQFKSNFKKKVGANNLVQVFKPL